MPWYNQNSDLFRVSKSKQALSDAGAKTGQALRSFGTATANKWTEIKWESCFEILSKARPNKFSGVRAELHGFFLKKLNKNITTQKTAF